MDEGAEERRYSLSMLDFTRKRAIEALKIPCRAVLATTGPAGVLAGEFACGSKGLKLYLLIPETSDHLFNLENISKVYVVTGIWEIEGEAKRSKETPQSLSVDFFSELDNGFYVLIEINPKRIHLRRQEGWGNEETIDFFLNGKFIY